MSKERNGKMSLVSFTAWQAISGGSGENTVDILAHSC